MGIRFFAHRPVSHAGWNPWLGLAARLGGIGATFLLVANVVYLLAPVSFLLELPDFVSTRPGGPYLHFFTDPVRLLTVGDFIAVLGAVILAGAIFLVLVGLARDSRVSIRTYALGVATFAFLAAWVPVTLYAAGRAAGTLGEVDAVAATGGWGLASLLLLCASLAFLYFTAAIEPGHRPRLTSFRWPMYAAVNVVGSAAIAGFFVQTVGGAETVTVFALGLTLRVSLVPVLGIVAYGDLRERFKMWSSVPIVPPWPKRERVVVGPRSARPVGENQH